MTENEYLKMAERRWGLEDIKKSMPWLTEHQIKARIATGTFPAGAKAPHRYSGLDIVVAGIFDALHLVGLYDGRFPIHFSKTESMNLADGEQFDPTDHNALIKMMTDGQFDYLILSGPFGRFVGNGEIEVSYRSHFIYEGASMSINVSQLPIFSSINCRMIFDAVKRRFYPELLKPVPSLSDLFHGGTSKMEN